MKYISTVFELFKNVKQFILLQYIFVAFSLNYNYVWRSQTRILILLLKGVFILIFQKVYLVFDKCLNKVHL